MKKTLTEEDVIKMIQEGNLDIKQLAAIAAAMGANESDEIGNKPASGKSGSNSCKPTVTFELTLCNYPDFCVTRTTPATVKQLVIMPSKGSYYITSLKGGDKAGVTKLDADLYAEFTSGMESIALPEGFWMTKVVKGKKVYDRMMDYLNCGSRNTKTMIDMIKDHCAPVVNSEYQYGSREWYTEYNAYKANPILYKEFYNKPKIRAFCKSYPDTVGDICKRFGLNNARDYLEALDISLVDPSTLGYVGYRGRLNSEFPQSVLPNYEMLYSAFKEYTLYMAVRFGYGLSWKSFFDAWADTLEMQKDIYGKVKEKYPDNLPTFHAQLSYKNTLRRTEIDAKQFARKAEEAAKLEWKMDIDEGRFIFVAPKAPEDFYDEATQQANCLASYVKKFTNGEDIIMFMRDKATPEVSEVTIEIVNGRITQAYRAHNASVTAEEATALRAWTKRFKLEEYIR